MKTFTALLTLALLTCFPMPSVAQDIAGSWTVETVSGVEPPEDASLTLALAGESKATITYTLAGESQSWQYNYAVKDGQLTLEPVKPFGETNTTTYDIKIEEGKLLLLSPKPEPVEKEAEASDEGATEEEDAEAEGEEAAEEETEAEAEEEEDNRVPVWVLVKAS